MKQTATKRILSLLLALAMMIVPMTVSVSAAPGELVESGEIVSPVEEVHEVVEDTSGLLPNESSIPHISGLPEGMGELLPLYRGEGGGSSRVRSARLSGASKVVGQKQTFIDDFNGGSYQTTVMAVGDNSVVYLQDNAKNRNTAASFVGEISNAFETEIFPFVTEFAGAPVFKNYGIDNICNFTGEKINIVLYDINTETNVARGITTAGYFYGNDFLKKSFVENGVEYGFPYSNEGPIIYVDISDYFGAKDIRENDGMEILGTLAHEYQHLVDHTYILSHFSQLDSTDLSATGSPTKYRNIWLNEGMSGMVERKFFATRNYKMTANHLNPYLAQIFPSGIGYVPTDEQWNSTNQASTSTTPYILSHYGSTSLLLQEFVGMGGDATKLVDNPHLGYANSLLEIGKYSGQGSFGDFFEAAMLNISVDSGTLESAVGQDLWWERYNLTKIGKTDLNKSTAFAGVLPLPANNVPYNSDGRAYYSQLYYKDTIGLGNQYVSFTLPANAEATYYLISAADPSKVVRTAAQWTTAAKTATKIVSGEKYEVGVGNGFAVLALNTATAVNESVLSYTLIETDKPYLDVSISDDSPFVYGMSGMSVPFTATAPDTTYNGKTLTVEGLDTAGNVVSGLSGATVTISGTTATGTVNIASTAPAGVYRLRVQDSTEPATLLGYSPDFSIHLKLSLGQSGQTIDPANPPNLTINVEGGAAKSDTGNFYATVDGVKYTATVKVGTATNSVSLPFASFRKGGDSLLVGYDKIVTIATDESSMVTVDGATNVGTALGSFTTDAEPGVPTVYPGTLNIHRGNATSANMLVYFGADTLEMEATVTSSDTAIASVDPATIMQSGDTVKVTAKERGTTTLTIGFSGSTTAGEPIQTSATVTVNVTGTPPVIPSNPEISDPGTTDPGTGDDSGGGSSGNGGNSGSGSSGSSGGSSGGGGSADSPSPTLSLTKATKDVAKEIAKAIAAGSKDATVRFKNIKDIPLETLKAMAAQAQKAGVTLTVNMDTVVNGKILMRQSFDPAKATKAIQFSASTTSGRAVSIAKLFAKYFSNKLEIFAFNQKEDFGMPVHTAILTSLTAEEAFIYSYDTTKNQYMPLDNPNIWKDKNGYLHFDTSLAGNIIFSSGRLVKK